MTTSTIVAAKGAYSYSGAESLVNVVGPSHAGSYSIVGNNVVLRLNDQKIINANPGGYSYTGKAVTLRRGWRIIAYSGALGSPGTFSEPPLEAPTAYSYLLKSPFFSWSASVIPRNNLLSFYNTEYYQNDSNPGGFANNGHRVNWLPILQDIAAVAEPTLGSTINVTRLKTYYTEGSAIIDPGGIGHGGQFNYINSIRDVAAVATALGLSGPIITRLGSYYNVSNYHKISNPGGFGRGGHRVNFEPSISDLIECGKTIALLET